MKITGNKTLHARPKRTTAAIVTDAEEIQKADLKRKHEDEGTESSSKKQKGPDVVVVDDDDTILID